MNEAPEKSSNQTQLFFMPRGDVEHATGPIIYYEGQSAGGPNEQMARAYYQALSEGVPMVDVQERAKKMIVAITELGRISSILYGLMRTVHRTSGDAVRERYGNGTPIVLKNAQKKALDVRYKSVRQTLGSVSGYQDLRENSQDIIRLSVINTEARVDWARFIDRFNGVDNNSRRDMYRRAMKKQITAQKRLRKKMGIVTTNETGKV